MKGRGFYEYSHDSLLFKQFRRTVLVLSDVLLLFGASPDTSVTYSSHPLTSLPHAALAIQQALRNSL